VETSTSASSYRPSFTNTTTGSVKNAKEYEQKLNTITKEFNRELGNMKRKMAAICSNGIHRKTLHRPQQ